MVFLFAILLCSSLIQWITVWETHVIAPGRPDAASYVSYAYNLREFGIYSREHTWSSYTPSRPMPDAISTPGYPIFLTMFLDGKPNSAFLQRVTVVQGLLGVITTLFAYLLAARMVSPMLACIVALLTALSPHLANISTYVLTESLFTCLLVISTWAFVRSAQSRNLAAWALAGVIFGLCCLVRPTLQALPPIVLLVVALRRKWRPLLRPVAIAGVCWVTLLMPWLVYQQSIPASADHPNSLRESLHHGSFPDFVFENHTENYGYPYRDDPHLMEIMASNAGLVHWVGQRMRAEPMHYLRWYLVGKPLYFLAWNNDAAGAGDIFIYPVDASPYFSRPLFRLVHAVMFGLHWPLMLLGVAGGLAACFSSRWLGLTPTSLIATRIIAAIFLSAIVIHMIGAPFPRYGIPFRPLAYALAVVSASALAGRWRVAREGLPTLTSRSLSRGGIKGQIQPKT